MFTIEGSEVSVREHNIYPIWFNNVILENQKLFYKNRYGEKIEIVGFNKSTNKDTGISIYYTEERSSEFGTPHKVYHVFKKDTSEHVTFTSFKEALKACEDGSHHTINSLFELHTALGGINCVDSKGNVSEFSNKVVVNFMNNIGSRKEGVSRNAPIN
jgi:hypothetical protein